MSVSAFQLIYIWSHHRKWWSVVTWSSPYFYMITLGLYNISGNFSKITTNTNEQQKDTPAAQHSPAKWKWCFLFQSQWHCRHLAPHPLHPQKKYPLIVFSTTSAAHWLCNLEQVIFTQFPTKMRSHFPQGIVTALNLSISAFHRQLFRFCQDPALPTITSCVLKTEIRERQILRFGLNQLKQKGQNTIRRLEMWSRRCPTTAQETFCSMRSQVPELAALETDYFPFLAYKGISDVYCLSLWQLVP